MSPLLEKVKNLVAGEPQEQKEEPKEEEDPPVRLRRSLTCRHRFGYLAKLPNNKPIPEECLTCQKLLECRNAPG